MKKVFSCILAVMICLCCIVPNVQALAPNPIMPLWNNVGDVNTSLTFYEDLCEAGAYATRGNSATSLMGTLTIYELQNGEWVYVTSSQKTTTRATLSILIEFEAESGVEYKAEFCITAYSGTTIIEEITDVEYGTCP